MAVLCIQMGTCFSVWQTVQHVSLAFADNSQSLASYGRFHVVAKLYLPHVVVYVLIVHHHVERWQLHHVTVLHG